QTFEHDAVVIAPHAVFTVELKSWGGTITGNRDRWTLDSGNTRPSPIPLILSKARILKGQLQARRWDLKSAWVQGLVFLSAGDATPQISRDYADLVITRSELKGALTDPSWLAGSRPLTPGQRRAIEDFISDGRPRKTTPAISGHKLLSRLPADDRPFDAWHARDLLTGDEVVLHVYRISGDTKRERKACQFQALREATLHTRLAGGPSVLQYLGHFHQDGDPERLILKFEDITPLQPLPTWLKESAPGLTGRLQVAHRLSLALEWVHDRDLIHRRLTLEAALVSGDREPDAVRLCAFDLAQDTSGAAPTITGVTRSSWSPGVAPEVLQGQAPSIQSDLFSFGTVLYELLTDRPLFQSLEEPLRGFELPPVLVEDALVPEGLTALLLRMLAVDPTLRPASAGEVAADLDAILHPAAPEPRPEPLLRPGAVLRQTYELESRLERGASGSTWLAKHLQTDQKLVLKVADPDYAPTLQREMRALSAAMHPNIVRGFNVEPFQGGNFLVMARVDGVTAEVQIGAGDPLTAAQYLLAAEGLLSALGTIHRAGWLHRDIKPENAIIDLDTGKLTVLDLGLACPVDDETAGDVVVGTVRYKDPLVITEGRWTPASDTFAAAILLFELLTGVYPFERSPGLDEEPHLSVDLIPDSYGPTTAEDLTTLFAAALSSERSRRLSEPLELLGALQGVIRTDVPQPEAPQPIVLPDDLTPEAPPSALDLSARALGTLSRLRIDSLGQLALLDPATARRLSAVGKKTQQELTRIVAALRRRWPDLSLVPPAPVQSVTRFFPALIGDDRSLSELGVVLSEHLQEQLEQAGIRSIGELGAAPMAVITGLKRIGSKRQEALQAALTRLAGQDIRPASLASLAVRLEAELGEARYRVLTAVIGLDGSPPRQQSEAAEALGISRQRIGQCVDLSDLRSAASHARILLELADALLPAAGFVTLESFADALTLRLPLGDGQASAIGFARLTALLLRPDARAGGAVDVRHVLLSPWTEENLDAQLAALMTMTSWPPLPRRDTAPRLWDRLKEDHRSLLRQRSGSAESLLDALLRLTADVRTDHHGRLFVPPVPLADALGLLRPELPSRQDADALTAAVEARYASFLPPDALPDAFRQAGYRLDDGGWVDPDRVEAAEEIAAPV
ncbi:MAG: serine/threonine protein kinase, partial [Myxococcota bacterium]